MILKDLVYQDGDYFFYYDKKAETYVICKDGLVCSSIIETARTYEQAKEKIEFHKKTEEK